MNKEEIKKILEEIIEKMGVSTNDVIVSESADGTVRFCVKTEESSLLIGDKGSGLLALNNLVKKIVEKKSRTLPADAESAPFFVDVNDYQEKKIEELKNKANILAERARAFKTEVEMEPMSSYERMIVHSIFTDTPDIKTESMGEGRERRVVIKPKETS